MKVSVRQRAQKDRAATLNAGDAVIVTRDDGSKLETTVRFPPWQLGHGDWVVAVEGISGGYDVMRVVRDYRTPATKEIER